MPIKHTAIALTAILFLQPLMGVFAFAALAKPLTPGDHTITLQHNSIERNAIVHIPPRADDKSALPVVLNFHGGGGHSANEQEYSLMDRLADRESFVVVYPNGTGRFSKRLLTWNAGTCCGYAALNHVDDSGFTRALTAKLAEMTPIDRRRVYATGLSNGGMMAHRLAAEAADVIAAVAPVAGGMVLPVIKSSRAVPVMHIHSIDDPRALYAGGLGPPFPMTNSRVFHPDVDRMILRWVKHNGCAAEPIVAERRADRDGRGHTATRHVYSNCRDGVEVSLWKLTGAGHVCRAASRNSWSASSALPPTSWMRIRRCGISSSGLRCPIDPASQKIAALFDRHSGQAGESWHDPESRNFVGACGTRPLWIPASAGMTTKKVNDLFNGFQGRDTNPFL